MSQSRALGVSTAKPVSCGQVQIELDSLRSAIHTMRESAQLLTQRINPILNEEVTCKDVGGDRPSLSVPLAEDLLCLREQVHHIREILDSAINRVEL